MDAGIWTVTGGLPVSGEDALEAAVRETEEEVGLKFEESEFKLIRKKVDDKRIVYVYMVYTTLGLEDLKINSDEVAQVKFVSKETIMTMIEDKEFVNYGREYLKVAFSL